VHAGQASSIASRLPVDEADYHPLADLYRADGKTWNSRHGSAGFACRIPASTGTRQLHRSGYPSKTEAKDAAEHVGKLVDLAPDEVTKRKIGDLVLGTKRGAPLPTVEDVRRRLMLGQDPGSTGVTFGAAWEAWLAGKRALRQSARARLEQIGEHWLLPVLADVPLEKLSGVHCAAVRAGRAHQRRHRQAAGRRPGLRPC
jgi:hypothetical protein